MYIRIYGTLLVRLGTQKYFSHTDKLLFLHIHTHQ